jgi:hypothetical protein
VRSLEERLERGTRSADHFINKKTLKGQSNTKYFFYEEDCPYVRKPNSTQSYAVWDDQVDAGSLNGKLFFPLSFILFMSLIFTPIRSASYVDYAISSNCLPSFGRGMASKSITTEVGSIGHPG